MPNWKEVWPMPAVHTLSLMLIMFRQEIINSFDTGNDSAAIMLL